MDKRIIPRGLTRRELLRWGMVGGAGLWLLGCGNETAGGGPDTGLASDAATGPNPDAAVGDGAVLMPDAATPPVCDETLENIEGPYYRAGAPTRSVLVNGATPGVHLSLSGPPDELIVTIWGAGVGPQAKEPSIRPSAAGASSVCGSSVCGFSASWP